MAALPQFSDRQLERVSRILGECTTGTEISRLLDSLGFSDTSGESTKWRRLYRTFAKYQKADKSPSKLIDFIRTTLAPEGFVDNAEAFETIRHELNTVIAFAGLEYGKDGKFRHIAAATTIDEAQRRVQTLSAKFQGRRLHSEVLRYCKPELLQKNYFHAVFEATKGLAQRIREMSAVEADGAALVDKVFSVDRPLLALNTLTTETEKSEHKGFASLLKGCFAAVRNPLAHQPKILWEGEDDAADYLSLISLLHRKLDDCVPTGLGGQP